MPLGLSPKYEQNLGFGGLSNQQFLSLAVGVANHLGWTVGNISEKGFVAYTPSSIDSPGEEFSLTIWDVLANIKSESPGSQMVDWGKNKENIELFVEQLALAKSSADLQLLEQQYDELKSRGTAGAGGHNFPAKNSLSDILAIFRPVPGYFVTPIIVDLDILVFIIMVMAGVGFWSSDGQTLISWGADYRPLTINGEWWRLLTSMFLHNGIVHLLANMFTLIYIGKLLEPNLGKLRFASAYLFTGIAASLASTMWNDNLVSAGASGAIFGLCGVFLATLSIHIIERQARKNMLIGLGVFVAYNLIAGAFKEGVDNPAHIGGLLSGLLIGEAYRTSLKKPEAALLERKTVAAIAMVFLIICWLFFLLTPNDITTYDSEMRVFARMENNALQVNHLPKNTPKDSLLAKLQNAGIYCWGKCIKVLDGLDDLHLPNHIRERNRMLKRYCALYISSYQVSYKAIYYHTTMFNDSEAYYKKNIRAVADSLKQNE
jgi:rhomboid protease GluP